MMTLLLWIHTCIYTVSLWVSKLFLVMVYGSIAFTVFVMCLCLLMMACDIAYDAAQEWKRKRK